MSKFHYLTKSRYLQGLQCPKLLWLSVNEPCEATKTPPATQFIFDMGHRVGKIAHQLFEGGVLVEEDHMHIREAEATTKALVEKAVPAIFEATVIYKDYMCRADILQKIEGKENLWDIFEVKTTSKVKPEVHVPDVAMQRFCFESAGYKIRKTWLMHVNSEYVRNGQIDPHELLEAEDISEAAEEHLTDFKKNSGELIKVLASAKCPSADPGKRCENPYDCPFYDRCNEPQEPYSVWELSGGSRGPAPKLEAMGVSFLKDIPEDYKLNDRHRSQVASVKTGKPVFDKSAIKSHLNDLIYPLYYFDFETFSLAVPPFDSSRPYENLPFQFSLDIQKKQGEKCEHFDFLLEEREDPRRKLIERMLQLLGTKGTIVAYNMSFEKGVIADLAIMFPEHSKKLNALLPRFWDLIIPFRSGAYAHCDFHGSASIKDVLPVLVPKLSYKDLDIKEGGEASLLYSLWMDGQMSGKDWKKTHKNLLSYCGLDTNAMVEIVKVLYKCAQ